MLFRQVLCALVLVQTGIVSADFARRSIGKDWCSFGRYYLLGRGTLTRTGLEATAFGKVQHCKQRNANRIRLSCCIIRWQALQTKHREQDPILCVFCVRIRGSDCSSLLFCTDLFFGRMCWLECGHAVHVMCEDPSIPCICP